MRWFHVGERPWSPPGFVTARRRACTGRRCRVNSSTSRSLTTGPVAATCPGEGSISYIRLQLMSNWALAPANTQTHGPQHRADLVPSAEHRAAHSAAVHGGLAHPPPQGVKNVSAIKESGRAPSAHPVGLPSYRPLRWAKSFPCSLVLLRLPASAQLRQGKRPRIIHTPFCLLSAGFSCVVRVCGLG